MLCNATRRLGDTKGVIFHQTVRGSIRAVGAVRNTWLFLTKTRVVADEHFEAWWKIANKSLGLFGENVEKDRHMGSIFRNQFHLLLMYRLLQGCFHLSNYT